MGTNLTPSPPGTSPYPCLLSARTKAQRDGTRVPFHRRASDPFPLPPSFPALPLAEHAKAHPLGSRLFNRGLSENPTKPGLQASQQPDCHTGSGLQTTAHTKNTLFLPCGWPSPFRAQDPLPPEPSVATRTPTDTHFLSTYPGPRFRTQMNTPGTRSHLTCAALKPSSVHQGPKAPCPPLRGPGRQKPDGHKVSWAVFTGRQKTRLFPYWPCCLPHPRSLALSFQASVSSSAKRG